MTAPGDRSCSHCRLPVGLRALQRTLDGEAHAFCCYGCCIAFLVKSGRPEESEAAWLLIRLGVGAFLSMNVMLISLLLYVDDFSGADAQMLPWIHLVLWLFATPALVILGWPYVRETWAHAVEGRVTSSALVVLGVGAAYAYSTFASIEGGGQVYFDTATMVLMLFTVGNYLEAAGRAKAARDLEPLLAAESECATIVEEGMETRRPVRQVEAGMVVRVRPGERIPVDGVVLEGESNTDEAVITGESRQVSKSVGSAVIAGSINLDGPLLIQSSGAGTATRWAQICRSVRDALSRRSPTQRLADRVVGASVPLVLILGGLTIFYWAQSLPFDRALLIGLAVLVVACPCAVGLAAPMATSLGIGRLARSGCLVRDPGALEALAGTRLLAFDKTGTLTSGKPHIVAIATEDVGPGEVLARAVGLERHSEHGLARAIIMAAAARGLEPVMTRDVRAVPGRGIRGSADGQAVAAGNSALMSELGWPLASALDRRARALEANGHTVIYVGWGKRVHAVLALDDTPLPEARTTIESLRRPGLGVVLLTGDLAEAARRVAMAVGIGTEEIQAGLAPEAKRAALERYRRIPWPGGDGRRRSQRRAGPGRGGRRHCGRLRHRSRPRNRSSRPALRRAVDAALGRLRGPHGSRNHPHQPDVGVWLQSCRAHPCGARPSAAGPGGCDHGEFEHPPGRQFAAAVSPARSRSRSGAAPRRRARQPTSGRQRSADGWPRDGARVNGVTMTEFHYHRNSW